MREAIPAAPAPASAPVAEYGAKQAAGTTTFKYWRHINSSTNHLGMYENRILVQRWYSAVRDFCVGHICLVVRESGGFSAILFKGDLKFDSRAFSIRRSGLFGRNSSILADFNPIPPFNSESKIDSRSGQIKRFLEIGLLRPNNLRGSNGNQSIKNGTFCSPYWRRGSLGFNRYFQVRYYGVSDSHSIEPDFRLQI